MSLLRYWWLSLVSESRVHCVIKRLVLIDNCLLERRYNILSEFFQMSWLMNSWLFLRRCNVFLNVLLDDFLYWRLLFDIGIYTIAS